MTTVEKIHHEIDTAQDRLLESALKVISETKVDEKSYIEQKADRLEKLGFSSSLAVSKAKEFKLKREDKLKTIQLNKEQAKQIQYYKQKYPLHKFLTEEELERICEKYSLIFAPADKYIKDIPEKNLYDIENMKEIEGEDFQDIKYSLIGNERFRLFMEDLGYPDCKITKAQLREKIIEAYGSCPDNWDEPNKKTTGLFAISKNIRGNHRFERCEIEDKAGLFIAAPKSHFNLANLENKTKHGFFRVTKVEPPDPIVFKYVKGGILVITKWGDEAEDEMLLNEINN